VHGYHKHNNIIILHITTQNNLRLFAFQIDGWIQENAQILRSHSVLRPKVVDIPRQQHEVADKKAVRTGPVSVQVRRDQIGLERVFQKTRGGHSAVHRKRFD